MWRCFFTTAITFYANAEDAPQKTATQFSELQVQSLDVTNGLGFV